MVNVKKHIDYWLTGAKDDWEVAKELVSSGRYRHGLFFAHLALEKILKAHICRNTRDLSPRLHNLVRLSELAELTLDQNQIEFLADMNAFNLEGRYPDIISPQISKKEASGYLNRTEDVFKWLIDLL
jgi:HEPN domain-containing protein